MKKLLKFLLLASVCIINSCEYPLNDEYIQNIEEPSTNQTAQIDLSAIADADTIEVFDVLNINYNFSSTDISVLETRVYVDGSLKSNSISSSQGSIEINPYFYESGYHEFTIQFVTTTGSGSIGDYLGTEGYIFEKSWIMVTDLRSPGEAHMEYDITPDGFLILKWSKCDLFNFGYYDLSGNIGNNYITKKISHKNDTFYIDSNYIGGDVSVGLQTHVKTENNSFSYNSLSFDEALPQIKFEEISVDSFQVFWAPSKFKAKYALSTDFWEIDMDKNTQINLKQLGPGVTSNFTLKTRPYHVPNSNSEYSQSSYATYAWGTYIAGNSPNYAYNTIEKLIYTSTYDAIEAYDIETLQQQNNYEIPMLMYEGLHATPNNSTKIASLAAESIYVFNSSNFQEGANIIPYGEFGGESVSHFYYTDNQLLAIAQPSVYELVDVNSKSVVFSYPITDYPQYSNWACITTSKNAEYFCIVTQNGLTLNKLENYSIANSYTDSRNYRSALFNKNNSSELLLTFSENKTLELRNSQDFSLILSFELPSEAAVLRNIDPESGYLLLSDYTKMYIVDLNNQTVILQINTTSSDYAPYLFGNTLFTKTGYAVDISTFLNKHPLYEKI